jgi:hypothetical protein
MEEQRETNKKRKKRLRGIWDQDESGSDAGMMDE